VLSSTLRRYFDSPNLFIVGAGRTDAGVHADGQHFHFDVEEIVVDTPNDRYSVHSGDGADKFCFRMNRMLPGDIRVLSVEEVDKSFHVMKSSQWKRYVYSFTASSVLLPRERNSRTHVYKPLDINVLRQALKPFEGTHDFRAFGNQLGRKRREQENFSSIRTIHSVQLVDEGQNNYKIIFEVNGALYKMIRNIVGVCFKVGGGSVEMDQITTLLNGETERDDHKSKPARAEGLVLEEVFFTAWE